MAKQKQNLSHKLLELESILSGYGITVLNKWILRF